ncbi:MAG: D-alanine--D-alanine ligase [Bacteroidales bacterium]|nr:D-alanine--D-alanine ligase [Bacteroidales bacterium]
MKRKIAVVAGGDSGEYEISLKSANVVLSHLDPNKFEPYLIVIRGKDWYYQDAAGLRHQVSIGDFTLHLPGREIGFDGVFIAIHGTPGEDGKLQGYYDLLGLPYSSCDQATSALTFNKYLCNHYVSGFGVRISKSVVINQSDEIHINALPEDIGFPLFVKPNRGGSSVGTSKVKSRDELIPALKTAFREDSQVMLEEYIPGREIACGVAWHQGKLVTLPLTEIISKNEFFDYEAKYEGKSEEITPAVLPDVVAAECRDISIRLYHRLNCRGIVRFDYILNGLELFFLEVNTIPGFSELSIVPQQALSAGISLQELFTEAMERALEMR